MTVKTIFIAQNGKEFYDEGECLYYEQQMKLSSIKDQFSLYDYNGKKMNEVNGKTFYIAVDTQEAAEILNEYIDSTGYSTPWQDIQSPIGPGKYLFNTDRSKWITYDELESCFKKVQNIFLKQKRK